MTKDTSDVVAKAVAFMNEAARYFGNRDTRGEDSSFWSNVTNQKNCEGIAALISSLVAENEALVLALSSIINCQSPLTKAQVREAASDLLEERGIKPKRMEDQSPFVVRAIEAERLLAEARAMNSWPTDAQFQYGDWVEKFTGEALWEGRVVSAYNTKRLALRYVVEVEPQGFQMIAVPAQLRASIGGGNG
jgi:hypothetical protein